MYPPNMTFKAALQAGYVKPIRNTPYLNYVASLTCPCGVPADEAHHGIDIGLGGGMGTKLDDLFTMPACRGCHGEIHTDVKKWEEKHGLQLLHILMTLRQAVEDGVITL